MTKLAGALSSVESLAVQAEQASRRCWGAMCDDGCAAVVLAGRPLRRWKGELSGRPRQELRAGRAVGESRRHQWRSVLPCVCVAG